MKPAVGMALEPAVLFRLMRVQIIQHHMVSRCGCSPTISFIKSRNSRLRRRVY